MEPKLTQQIVTGLWWVIDVADSTRSERLTGPATARQRKILNSAEKALKYLDDLVQWHTHGKDCPRCQDMTDD